MSGPPAATARITRALLQHLSARGDVSALGIGGDAYSRISVEHPMAIAMYVRGLVRLAKVRGDDALLADATRLADRLASLRAKTDPRFDAWGLGFRWRRSPASEPYAVTTALCTLSLVELHDATRDTSLLPRISRAARWLAAGVPWSVLDGGAGPWFSPRIAHVVPNVAAMTAAALHAAVHATGETALLAPARAADRWVLACQHRSGLWTYGYTGREFDGRLRPRDIIDTVHTAYVLDGLIGAATWGGGWTPRRVSAVRRGTQFLRAHAISGGDTLVEKLVLVRRTDALSAPLLARPKLVTHALGRDESIVRFPAEARLWNYGALLGAVGRAHAAAVAPGDWIVPLADRLLTVHAARADGRLSYLPTDRAAYPRHEAHAVEGLAQLAVAHRQENSPGAPGDRVSSRAFTYKPEPYIG